MTIAPSLLVFFPMLLGLWQETPFTPENTSTPVSPTFLARDAVRAQERFYRQLLEPDLRSRIALELGNSNNPEAIRVLSALLPNESDAGVLADLLHGLDQLRTIGKCPNSAELAKLMRHEQPLIRGQAMALTIAAGEVAPVLELCPTEQDPFVQRLAWERLEEVAERCPPTLLRRSLQAPSPLARAGASRLLCRHPQDPDEDAALGALTGDSATAVRAALAAALGARADGGAKLLTMLAADRHPTVRAGVAAARGGLPARLTLQLRLSADADSEVRRLACRQLRDYSPAEVSEALLARLDDSDEAVRIAAEDSLIALRPGVKLEDRLLTEYLARPTTRAAAAKVLGALRVTRATTGLRQALAEGGDFEFLRRTITALGQLQDLDSWPEASKAKTHPRAEVRQALAWALGQLAVPASFPILIELGQDRSAPVFTEALTSMGRIGDPCFAETLKQSLQNVNPETGSPQRRSTAAWAWARNRQAPDEVVLRQAENICMKKIIPVLGVMTYDADHARLAAAFFLVQAALRDAQLRPRVAKTMVSMVAPAPPLTEPVGGLALQVFARQAQAYLNGQPATPEPVPVGNLTLTITPLPQAHD